MKRSRMIALILALLPLAHANATDSPITGNVALTSDYMFRGLTQSWGRPAIQGCADYANSNGFAAGVWGSSISERSYPGGAMELDLYASYGRAISSDWSWRAGVYGYVYPGANLDQAGLPSRSLNTAEANVGLSWKLLTMKCNRTLTDYFGVDTQQGYRGHSRGTSYLQLDLAIPLSETWSVALHAAHTHYTITLATPLANGARSPGYNDFAATLKYQLATQWSLSGGVTYASNADFYRHTSSFLDASDTRQVGGSRRFVMLAGNVLMRSIPGRI
ncbi:MAG: TorF family putative porin [Rhodanobacter sp.]